MVEEIPLSWDEIASRWNPVNAGLKKADLISSKAKAEDFIRACEDFIVQSTISLICLRFYDSLYVLISQRKRTQRVRFF